MDFHSYPWLLKCHRVSWFECKVAQLAPIMSNVKTCEDSFLNQPRDRQNTHASLAAGSVPVCWRSNQRPFNHCWPPTHWKSTASKYFRQLEIFKAIFSRSSTSVKVVLSKSGWMFCCLPYIDSNVINLGHTPQQLTCLPCYYFCLCVCERLLKKAISVRIESSFVIGLPYSTVIY